MLRTSKIEQVLKNKFNFLEDMYQSIEGLFNHPKSEEIYDNKEDYDLQIVKAYRSENNDFLYLIEKTNFGFRLYFDEIHDFQKEKTIKEILHWDNLPTESKKKEIYSIKVIAIPNNPTEAFKTVNETYMNEVYEKVQGFYNKSEKKESIEMTNQEKEDLAHKILMIGGVTVFYSTTNNVEELKNFMDYTNKVYDDSFYIDLIKEDCKSNNTSLFDQQIKIKNLIEVCKNNNYTSLDKAYEFNDLDNHVWIDDKNNLLISDQNIYFYIKLNDEKNYTIYMGFKDLVTFDEFKNNIENNNISKFKDVFLEVTNNQTTYINQCYNECFTLDLDFSVEAMERDELMEINYPEDIYSYEYQKNYIMNKYNYSEFEFIVQAMMTTGGGFEYDENNGSFYTTSVKYEEDLKEAKNDRDVPVKEMTYLNPKVFNYLNNDWKDALEYAVEVLKRDRPTPVVYTGDNVDDALDKAIKFFELKLNKLKTKPAIK